MLTTENCFNFHCFSTYYDAAYGVICEDDYAESLLGGCDYGWQLEALLDCFQQGMTPAAAIAEMVDGYDPTPQTPYDWFH